jgi:hypothetical protein
MTPEVRFPGFHVMARADRWDERTRDVVLGRLRAPSGLQFFTAHEEPTVTALLRALLDLGDDDPPVLAMVDRRLAAGQTDGYRYADMPTDGDAFRRSLAALDEQAAAASPGQRFHDLSDHDRRALLESIRATDGQWHGLPAGRAWSLWMRYGCAALCAHPWQWDDMGFGGPAYPEGYTALGLDKREPWEVADHVGFDPVPWSERVERARARHGVPAREPEPGPAEDEHDRAGRQA